MSIKIKIDFKKYSYENFHINIKFVKISNIVIYCRVTKKKKTNIVKRRCTYLVILQMNIQCHKK